MRRTLAILAVLASVFSFVAPTGALACVCYDTAGTQTTFAGTVAECNSVCGTTTATVQTSPADTCACGGTGGTRELNCATVCTNNKQSFTDPTAAATAATVTPLVGYAIPQLNIDIPGVDFTIPTDKSGVATSNFIGEYVAGVYRYLIGFAMTIAIVMIMVGGLQYVLGASSGDITKGKNRIWDAIEGFVLLMFVHVILFTVNPELILFRPLSIGNIARVVWEEQVKVNLAGCGEVKGLVPVPCAVTTLKNPTGWSQTLTDAVNAAALLKGVDANLVAAHLQMETGGNVRYKGTGPCGEVGPSQFMPTTAESITSTDCCESIVRGPKKKVTAGEKAACGKSLDSAVWPPSKTAFPTRCEEVCGNCQVASAACVARFNPDTNLKFIIESTAELVKRNLKAAGGDFAMEMCAYNGSGKAAAAYAQKAAGIYKTMCENSSK